MTYRDLMSSSSQGRFRWERLQQTSHAQLTTSYVTITGWTRPRPVPCSTCSRPTLALRSICPDCQS